MSRITINNAHHGQKKTYANINGGIPSACRLTMASCKYDDSELWERNKNTEELSAQAAR